MLLELHSQQRVHFQTVLYANLNQFHFVSKFINLHYFEEVGPFRHPILLPMRSQTLFITDIIGGMQFCTRKEIFNFSQNIKSTLMPFFRPRVKSLRKSVQDFWDSLDL